MYGRDADRMLDMWMDLLHQIEQVPSGRHAISTLGRKDVSVNEENGTITITAELAGLDKEQVDVEVSNRTVTIAANSDRKNFRWEERSEERRVGTERTLDGKKHLSLN